MFTHTVHEYLATMRELPATSLAASRRASFKSLLINNHVTRVSVRMKLNMLLLLNLRQWGNNTTELYIL